MSTFDEIAERQGWNADSREGVLREFIDGGFTDLDEFAQRRADEENAMAGGLPGGMLVPNLKMDVTGEYSGNAYPEEAEYRIVIEFHDHDEGWLMEVEHASGAKVGGTALTPEIVDGIVSMAQIDHGLGGYEDDWEIPAGMDRHIEWVLQTDMPHYVRLDESQIDEIAAWLRFATGAEEWTGGSEWEW